MAAPICVAVMAETSTTALQLGTERPGPYPNGTLCVVRSTRKIYYWAGSGWSPVL